MARKSNAREYGWAIALGSLGGLAVGLGVWWYASRQLDAQLAAGGSSLTEGLTEGRQTLESRLREGQAQLTTQVRSQVRSQLTSALADVGLTPQRAHQISQIVDAADRAGFI